MSGEPALWGKAEGVRYLIPGEEKAQGEPHYSMSVLKAQLQRGQKISLHQEPHGEHKGQQVQVSP